MGTSLQRFRTLNFAQHCPESSNQIYLGGPLVLFISHWQASLKNAFQIHMSFAVWTLS